MKFANIFTDTTKSKPISAGTSIFKNGDKGQEMYVVMEGEVDIFIDDCHLETVPAEGIFGELSLIDQETRIASAIARTDCTLQAIDKRHFLFLVQETPLFAIQVMKVMADRLRRVDRLLAKGDCGASKDGSFVAGQGWRWFIFGDVPGLDVPGVPSNVPSPISDFAMTSPVPAPWETLTNTGGAHNGPTFGPVKTYWIPSLGDTLLWSGTSATELLQGQLLFSTLDGSLNGGVEAIFEVAHHVDSFPASVPDAGQSLVLMMLGLGGLAGIGILQRERSWPSMRDTRV